MSAATKSKKPQAQTSRTVGRPPKRTDQKQRILHSAAKSIASLGFEQCSLADIATDLDLTRPALYHYFSTKQQIFTEIALTAVQGNYDFVSAAVASSRKEGSTSCAQLRTLMKSHAEYFDDNYWIVNATIAGYGGIARRELERIEEIDHYRDEYRELLHQILIDGIASGELRQTDVKISARAIFQLLNITRWYRPGGEKSAVDIALNNFNLVIGGLAVANSLSRNEQ